MNDNGIILKNALPMPDNLKEYNILYVVFFIIGIVYGLAISEPQWYLIGLLALALALIIKEFIAIRKLAGLRKLEFNLPVSITGQDLAGIIVYPLTELGMTVTFSNSLTEIRYKGMVYLITINDNDTFNIIFDRTFTSHLIGGRRYISEYKKAIVAFGLIAHTIQNELSKSIVR